MKIMIFLVLSLAAFALRAGPLLKITPPAANFGKFSANLSQQQRFILSNPGDEPLIIDKVKVSCGCSAAKVEKNELKPGESTVLYGEIKPESLEGPFAKAIFIHSNAANGSIQMLTLNGEAQPLVKVLPQKLLHAGVRPPNQLFELEFVLRSEAGVQFAAPDITGELEVRATLTPVSERESKLRLTFAPQKELARFRTTVKIAIDTPRNWKPVEILIEGAIKP